MGSDDSPKNLGAFFSALICFLLCSSIFVVLFHSDDDIPLFVSFVDIPVSFDNVCQRITSINDRFYLSRFNEFFEVN